MVRPKRASRPPFRNSNLQKGKKVQKSTQKKIPKSFKNLAKQKKARLTPTQHFLIGPKSLFLPFLTITKNLQFPSTSHWCQRCSTSDCCYHRNFHFWSTWSNRHFGSCTAAALHSWTCLRSATGHCHGWLASKSKRNLRNLRESTSSSFLPLSFPLPVNSLFSCTGKLSSMLAEFSSSISKN